MVGGAARLVILMVDGGATGGCASMQGATIRNETASALTTGFTVGSGN